MPVYRGYRTPATKQPSDRMTLLCWHWSYHNACDCTCVLLHYMASAKQTITPYQAIKRMRQLSDAGIPFTFGFYTYNASKNKTDGYKVVPRALFRLGLRNDQSDKAHILVAYSDHSKGGADRFFYLPLLMMFNGYVVKP